MSGDPASSSSRYFTRSSTMAETCESPAANSSKQGSLKRKRNIPSSRDVSSRDASSRDAVKSAQTYSDVDHAEKTSARKSKPTIELNQQDGGLPGSSQDAGSPHKNRRKHSDPTVKDKYVEKRLRGR